MQIPIAEAVSISKASPISKAEQPSIKPNELSAQITKILDDTPELVCAVTQLESNKIEQMIPHLKEVVRILQGYPLAQVFAHLENLCTHYEDLQQIKNLSELFDDFFGQDFIQAPITIKSKTKIKFVYAPQYGAYSKGQIPADFTRGISDLAQGIPGFEDFAKDISSNKMRIVDEASQDFKQLKDNTQAMHSQLSKEMLEANEQLQSDIKEAHDTTRKEIADTIDWMRAEVQKAYDDLNKDIGSLRQEMQKQLENLNTELEDKKKIYHNNVDGLVSSIRESLDRENEIVGEQVSQVTGNLQQRLSNANTELESKMEQARTRIDDEVKKAADDIDAQVKDIKKGMQAAMEAMRKDMENIDEELKQSIQDAYNGAQASAMNTKSQGELDNTIADMKKSVEEVREEMRKEIQEAIQSLFQVKSELAEIMKAKNTNGVVSSTPTAKSVEDELNRLSRTAAKGIPQGNIISMGSKSGTNGQKNVKSMLLGPDSLDFDNEFGSADHWDDDEFESLDDKK